MTKVLTFTVALAVAFVALVVYQQLDVEKMESNEDFQGSKGTIPEADVQFIQWETCIKVSLENGLDCNKCNAFNPDSLDFQTDLIAR